MSIAKTDSLKNLIHSLSKSEKRHFKVYSHRLISNKEGLFLRLFDLIEKKENISEKELLKDMSPISKMQFSNLKRHLFLQILKSLRILYATRDEEMILDEKLDYSILLKEKGLYEEAIELVDRIDSNELKHLPFHNLKKLNIRQSIHNLYGLSSRNEKGDALVLNQAQDHIKRLWRIESTLLNLDNLFGELSYVRNDRELKLLRTHYATLKSDVDFKEIHSFTLLKYYDTELRYYQNSIDFVGLYRTSIRKLRLIKKLEFYKVREDQPLFKLEEWQSYSGILKSCYLYRNESKFGFWYKKYLKSISSYNLSELPSFDNSRYLLSYVESLFLNGAIHSKNRITGSKLRELEVMIDKHLRFFKNEELHRLKLILAVNYAYSGNYEQSVVYLNIILKDVNCGIEMSLYVRLISIMCHYRLSHFELVTNLLPGIRNAFNSNGLNTKTVELTLNLLRKGIKALNFGMKDLINEYAMKLKVNKNNRYEKLPFLYFDFLKWFESIKQNVSVDKLERPID